MEGPWRCLVVVILELILLHVVICWSPVPLPAPALFTLRDPKSSRTVIPNRKMVFGSRAMQSSFDVPPTTRLYGVLSRSAILKHSSGSNKNKKRGQKASTTSGKGLQPPITRTFLMDALEEAVYRQTTALECLELERCKLIDKLGAAEIGEQETESSELKNDGNEDGSDGNPDTKRPARKERDPRIALNRVDLRRLELRERLAKLEELRRNLVMEGNRESPSRFITTAESRFRTIMGSTGKLCSILDRPKETWKIVAERSKGEFGRPRGFTGLVFYSPLGVPILVGKPKTDSDGILRRASQGSDLWFQVEDYEGSRVLLRSSLVRGTKDSKRCLQMAADLAAFYSVWGAHSSSRGGSHNPNNDCIDIVPVMYTDSKHVAKRGNKVGRMRKRKSMGRVMGRPSSVEAIARVLKPS